MGTLLVAVGSFLGFIIAYYTYGRWLSRRIFALDPNAVTPSYELQDDIDFVPTKKEVIFGHHFTSIAGTGPIVGPAIAVFWGWLPALVWVLLGSIFIGAVHDFGALVVSLRNRGQTVGEIAGRMITPRAKILFLLILLRNDCERGKAACQISRGVNLLAALRIHLLAHGTQSQHHVRPCKRHTGIVNRPGSAGASNVPVPESGWPLRVNYALQRNSALFNLARERLWSGPEPARGRRGSRQGVRDPGREVDRHLRPYGRENRLGSGSNDP